MITVGLDIGTTSVKLAVLGGSTRHPRLLDFIEHRLEAGQSTRSLGPEALATLVRGLFRRHRLPADRVVAGLPSVECLVRDLWVPFTRDDQIRKTVRFQAESVFQSVPIEELLIQYHKIGEHQGRSHLLVFGLRRTSMRRYLDMLEMAEIDPIAVELDVGALVGAFLAGAEGASAQRTLLCDLGGGSLKMAVVEQGQIRTMRALRLRASAVQVVAASGAAAGGGQGRPRTLEELRAGLLEQERDNTFFADADEEDEGRLPVVILDDEQADLFELLGEDTESRQSVLEKIFVELDRTLVRTPLGGPIELVLLSGGGAAADGIERAFAAHFECECRRLRLDRALLAGLAPAQREAVELGGASAVGLALKGAGRDRTGVDFRIEEFRYAGTFERLKRGLACTLVLAFILFFLLAYRYKMVETQRLDDRRNFLLQYQKAIYERVFAHEGRPAPPDVWGAVARRQLQLMRRGAAAELPEVPSALDMLRDLALVVQQSGKRVELLEASLRRGRSTVTVKVADTATVYELKRRLNERESAIARMLDPDIDRREDGGFTATLRLEAIEHQGPAGARPPLVPGG
ncbi:MAG: hypothetical protein KatS3mg102_1076 [Planctomycetota bacterium]|nr:MAG: hypothetical protein KatS3mg102_1076 [Planctomycetota bacterium]